MPFVGIGVGVGRQRFAGGGGFDADYQAVLNYATTQGYTLPSASQQELQNQLVVDLKDGGIWSKLDTFGVFATDGDSDFALIDWKRLSQNTAVNSPTFISNGGYEGDGLSSYIDTNFNANLTTIGDITYGFWATNGMPIGTFEAPIGAMGTLGLLYLSNNNNRIFYSANSNLIQFNGNITQTEFISVSSDGINATIDRNGVNQLSRSITTNDDYDFNVFVLARNANGTAIQFSSDTLKMYFISTLLTSQENIDFYNALNTYISLL